MPVTSPQRTYVLKFTSTISAQPGRYGNHLCLTFSRNTTPLTHALPCHRSTSTPLGNHFCTFSACTGQCKNNASFHFCFHTTGNGVTNELATVSTAQLDA